MIARSTLSPESVSSWTTKGEVIVELVRAQVGRKDAAARISAWSKKAIEARDRARFAEIAEAELIGLHKGYFARYRIRLATEDRTIDPGLERFVARRMGAKTIEV